MHPFSIPEELASAITRRRGHLHAFREIDAKRTALIVVDMQNAFVKEGAGHSFVPAAASVCPNINRLAGTLRARGGVVVWILNTYTRESDQSWSHFHQNLSTPAGFKRRSETMAAGTHGHELYAALEPKPEDLRLQKTRYSAFIAGSSGLEETLRARGIDTLFITGTATNVCCESTGRDAMMLNFKTILVSDGCAAQTDAIHAASLHGFMLNFGDVYDTNEAIGLLERSTRAAAE